MGGQALCEDGWTLREAVARDVAALMGWFTGRQDVVIWGGPDFRYPFTRASFFEDVRWRQMPAYSLFDPGGEFAGFGQIYDRDRHIHLARLIVEPAQRGHGVGRRLVELLMRAGRAIMPHRRYSLFVFRENAPALGCYRSLGFEISDYPRDMPHADVCFYLTKSD